MANQSDKAGFLNTIKEILTLKSVRDSMNIKSLIETSTDPKVSSVALAEGSRSIVTSSVSVIICTLIKLFITAEAGVSPLNDYIFVQMIFGNLLGFIFDQAFATKEGFGILNKKKAPGLVTMDADKKIIWNGANFRYDEFSKTLKSGGAVTESNLGLGKYVLKKAGSNQFIKYCITVLIDIIISTILYSIATTYYRNKHAKKEKENQINPEQGDETTNATKKPIDKMTDLMLQGGIGLITFYVYVNITRLSWAYVDQPDKGVSIGIIALGIASSMGYLVMAEGTEYFETIKGKITMVGSLFTLLFILSLVQNNKTLINGIWWIGAVLITLIILVCLVGLSIDSTKNNDDDSSDADSSDADSSDADSSDADSDADSSDADSDDDSEQNYDSSDDENDKKSSTTKKTLFTVDNTNVNFDDIKCENQTNSKSSYTQKMKNAHESSSHKKKKSKTDTKSYFKSDKKYKSESNSKLESDSESKQKSNRTFRSYSNIDSNSDSDSDVDVDNNSNIDSDSERESEPDSDDEVETTTKCSHKEKTFLSKLF